jgi:hypothetical protein
MIVIMILGVHISRNGSRGSAGRGPFQEVSPVKRLAIIRHLATLRDLEVYTKYS